VPELVAGSDDQWHIVGMANENTDDILTFAEWTAFDAQRIVEMGMSLANPEEARGYMILNIQAAIRKAYRHGKKGLGEDERIPLFG
jgi:hypothetical protein